MTFSRNSMINKLVKREIEKGGRFLNGRKHGKLYTRNGSCIIVPRTPSDKRAGLNFRAFLRRNIQGASL